MQDPVTECKMALSNDVNYDFVIISCIVSYGACYEICIKLGNILVTKLNKSSGLADVIIIVTWKNCFVLLSMKYHLYNVQVYINKI